MTDRLSCSVDGCKRSKRLKPEEVAQDIEWVWICPVHWRRLTKIERRVLHRFNRIRRRFGTDAVSDRRFWRVWKALARRASL